MISKAKIKNYLKHKLSTDERWAKRALLVIWSRQTESEKITHTTMQDNGQGFSGNDAEFLTALADQLRIKGFLSAKQMAWVFKKMPRYWAQLLDIAESNPVQMADLRQKTANWLNAQTPQAVAQELIPA